MRIVCDVSTSVAWTRPPVGIVRTEQKFARFLLGRPDVEVAFCRFDRAGRRYVELSRSAVAAILEGQAAPAEAVPARAREPDETPARLAFRLRTRAWVGRLAGRCIEGLPEPLRPDATLVVQSADQLVRSLYWLGRKAGHGLRSRGRAPGVPPPAPPARDVQDALLPGFPFRPTDCYVSMGLDWDFNDLAVLWARKRACGFRTVLYCYDVIPVYFPHLMSFDARQLFALYFVNLAHCADHVVAISEATRSDCLAFLGEIGAPTPPVRVVHLGTDVQERGGSEGTAPHADLARQPFVLYVSTIEARKNHDLLYHVWDRLVAKHGDRSPYLVLVGMVGWGVQDLLARLRLNPRLAGKVLVFDQLSDEQLVWLYRHCRFSVFPSFYEGWGLPVAESLTVGTPCIVSTAPAVLEASQGLVPALDPLDFGGWLAQVEEWAFEPAALAAATARVRASYAPLAWRRHGEEMLRLVRELETTERCASSI